MASASETGSVDVVMLDDFQLRKLAKVLLNQEESLMKSIKSEPERAIYLQQCNEAYDDSISLMDSSNNLCLEYQRAAGDDREKASIAEDIRKYIQEGINMSLQCIRNCSLRVSCVSKIKAHFDTLVDDLKRLDPGNVTDMRRMAKDVSLYKECMWEYASKTQSGSARATSKAYSLMLKQDGIKFPDLVERHKNELGFEGKFVSLEAIEKLKVYNSIVKAAGRAKIPKMELLSSKATGITLLVVVAGFMVWDIYTAEHKIEAALRIGLSALSDVGTFAVQVAVKGAVTTAMLCMEVGAFVVSLAGFVAGAVAGFIFAAGCGFIIDLIMGTGGNVVPNLDDLKFHSATMPDGMALANEIAHNS